MDIHRIFSIATFDQWPFQEPKLKVPTIYRAYWSYPASMLQSVDCATRKRGQKRGQAAGHLQSLMESEDLEIEVGGWEAPVVQVSPGKIGMVYWSKIGGKPSTQNGQRLLGYDS